MFLNASSKLNLGFKTPAFFVAIFMVSVLVAFSSCSKDDPNVITNDVTGEYSGFNAFLGFGTGNIDMKITSVGSDEIELQFLTDYHHDTGTYFKLSQDVFNLKLTKGANGRISLTMPAKMMMEIPLPRPRSVTCSPSHIRNIVPVTNVVTVVNLNNSPGSMTSPG